MMTSMPMLVPLGISAPLLLALLLLISRQPWLTRLVPFAALPALITALVATPDVVVRVPLLLGMHLGLSTTTGVFLLFSAGLWLLAAGFAVAYLGTDQAARRFFIFFLVTMSGNLGVVLARDLVSFYLFFAVMSFAAYGLVTHDRSAAAMRAGKVYLILVIIGEAFVLPAMLLSAVAAGDYSLTAVPGAVAASPWRNLIIACALIGFGVKVGAVPLHFWLPLAHPAAPVPASAVLSGAMIKTGLLGWLVVLPLGAASAPNWGMVWISMGLVAAFYGVVVGVLQTSPKTILAYSSISQMGLMTVGVGVGLLSPEVWPLAAAAIVVYAAHHAFAKGALFIGVGMASRSQQIWQRALVGFGLMLAALALAGAPLTSGAIAKYTLKTATGAIDASWIPVLDSLLQLAAVGTTALMGRFLLSMWAQQGQADLRGSLAIWGVWLLLVGAVAGAVILQADQQTPRAVAIDAIWPVALGVLLVGGVVVVQRMTGAPRLPTVPEGDLLVAIGVGLNTLDQRWQGWASRLAAMRSRTALSLERRRRTSPDGDVLAHLDRRFTSWAFASSVFLVIVMTLFMLHLVR